MQLSFGRPSAVVYPTPSQPLSFGSLAQYGQTPYTVGAAPLPTPAPAVPSPAPAVPAAPEAYASTYGGPTVDSVLNGTKTTDALTNALTGAMSGGGPGDWFKSTFMRSDGSFNFDNIGAAVNSVGALGNLWSGFKANRLASDALDFQKEAYRTNLDNQTSSYNMALEDRIRSRYAQEGRGAEAADAYIAKHKLGR